MLFTAIGALLGALFGGLPGFLIGGMVGYGAGVALQHPDKLAARGFPESMRAVAEERSRELNSAYDIIKSARTDVR